MGSYILLLIFMLIVASIVTEAVTEIVVKSDIFFPFRKKIFNIGNNNNFFKWISSLLECGHCFSVWSGMFISFLIFNSVNLIDNYLSFIIVGLLTHRLSNLVHDLSDMINRTRDKI